MKDKQKFIEENTSLVYFLINKYYPSFSSDEDIIQCGMTGLCEAVSRWEGKCKFSHYAQNWILGEIRKELRDRNKHSVDTSLETLLEDKRDEHY